MESVTVTFEASRAYAQRMDQEDPLHKYRSQFHFPRHEGKDSIYLCGNSLGLQPKSAKTIVNEELEDWANLGVEGHFTSRRPWFSYHHFFTDAEANLVGAKPGEVVVMNTLTANIHFMMVSFYRPTAERYKILIDWSPFPSDHYVVESQARFHGYDPDDAIIELQPREGEQIVRKEDILQLIEDQGDEIALVMMGGVNYYTGQAYPMKEITAAAHAKGANVGFDLAHAAGNLDLQLHDWDVDFAVWCTYKYLNSGPGGPGGVFVHERHANSPELPRFAGWWGHDEEARFLMKPGFKPMEGAAGWQNSNAQIMGKACHFASLQMFDEVGIKALREKSVVLTNYMEFLINKINEDAGRNILNIITPSNVEERGAQLSIVANENGKQLHESLTKAGIVADWREPDVIRVAAVPMYNSFEDVYSFYEIINEQVK